MSYEIRILIVTEEKARRLHTAFLKDYVDFYINESCPYCGNLTLIVPQSTLRLPQDVQEETRVLMNKVAYPTVARCTMCNKVMVAGSRT